MSMKRTGSKDKENIISTLVRNTFWNFIFALISRGGALIFTIIIARLLQPEFFGIYNLALSITLMLVTLADLGINSALVRYMSDALGRKNKREARSYFAYLFKLKLNITLIMAFGLIIFAKFISISIFNKPDLFYPLIISGAYLFLLSITNFLEFSFVALKKIKDLSIKELIRQSTRILFVIFILYAIAESYKVVGVIASLICATIASIIILFILIKKNAPFLFKEKRISIDKRRVLRYIGFLAIGSLTAIFFAYIDTIMLGIFIPKASYVGFYRAAFALTIALIGLLSLTNVFFPIFTQLKGKRFGRGFQKAFKYSAMASFPAAFGLILVSKPFIAIIYGADYLQAAIPLYILAFLIIEGSTGSLFNTAFKAKEKPKILMKVMILATIMNIILNFILIKAFLPFGMIYATLGAASATVISRYFSLIFLMVIAKTKLNLKIKASSIVKPLIASIIMASLVILFRRITDLSWPISIVDILFGIIVYIIALWLIKGFQIKEVKDLVLRIRK